MPQNSSAKHIWNFKVFFLAKTLRETTSALQHPLLKKAFINTFLHMWDGWAQLSIDRKKNMEIREGVLKTCGS